MQNSPFNMRQYNLTVMKPPVSKNVVAPTSSKVTLSYTTAAKSLDLLRQNIQRNINHEIQNVISKYLEMFFKPGIENIRNNLGPDAVTDEHISNMCRQILEEAKRMYPIYATVSPCSGVSNVNAMETPSNDSSDHVGAPTPPQAQGVSHQQPQHHVPDIKLPLTSPSFAIKRESDTDSEASCLSTPSKKAKKSSNKANNDNASATATVSANGGNKNGNSSSSTDNSSPAKPKKPSGPSRKHVALWDSAKLTSDTMFIMGAKANKALGFAQTRGRLYVKHPGLFKYASDADDKEWLSKNKLMPATGGRAYIMLLEDIEKLAKDNRMNLTISYEDIKGFKVPDFILDKMKNFINTWKKTYADEDEKHAAAALHRNRNAKSNTNNEGSNNSQLNRNSTINSVPDTPNHLTTPGPVVRVATTAVNSVVNVPPPPPPPIVVTLPDIQQQYQKHPQQQHQTPNHGAHQSQSLNNFLSASSSGVLYDAPVSAFPTTQGHEMTDYIHIDKPPPMYPGPAPPAQQQQQQPPIQQINSSSGSYLHSNQQLDHIEQAISKGDWSQVSDRSLLQYALQSTRNIGSGMWDPQDSFDLIESVTNGGLVSGSGIGETSPLLQISPNAGAHLTAQSSMVAPVSPNCELSAVLDQVSAFQYTET